jgi:hypothetical protein
MTMLPICNTAYEKRIEISGSRKVSLVKETKVKYLSSHSQRGGAIGPLFLKSCSAKCYEVKKIRKNKLLHRNCLSLKVVFRSFIRKAVLYK